MQTIYKPTVLAAAMAVASGVADANPIPEHISQPDNALKALTGFNHNETALMKDLGLHFGGWVDFGYTHNFDSSDNFNTPTDWIAFRNDRVLLNQINLFLERAVDTEGGHWDLGGRVDVMYGSDSPFTQAFGLEISDEGKQKWIGDTDKSHNLNKLALPQFYLEVYAPVLNGITAKFGHFYPITGYYALPAPARFFYTPTYTVQFGEPFSHTGALFSMPLVDNLSITVGAVNGWDNFSANIDDAWNFIGGLNWDNGIEGNGATSVTLTAIHGTPELKEDTTRSHYSIVLDHYVTDQFHFVLQHDHGWDSIENVNDDPHWYGIIGHLFYDINDMLAIGTRMEWFRDEGGIRTQEAGIRAISTGKSTNYYAMTFGLNVMPTNWFKIRPEIRYDWAENSNPFDEGSQDDQLMFSVDAVINLF